MSDNKGLTVNGQTEKRLNADPQALLIKLLYVQVPTLTVDGCKVSPAWGRLKVRGGRAGFVQGCVQRLGIAPA